MEHPPVIALDPRCTVDHVGFIPTFLDLDDPRPAAEAPMRRAEPRARGSKTW